MATVSFDVPDIQLPRIRAAFGKVYRLTNPDGTPRDATGLEVKQFVMNYVKGVVQDQEIQAARAALAAPASLDLV